MIPLVVMVRDVFGDRVSEVVLADRYDPIEALRLDRPHESFAVRLGIGLDVSDDRPLDNAEVEYARLFERVIATEPAPHWSPAPSGGPAVSSGFTNANTKKPQRDQGRL